MSRGRVEITSVANEEVDPRLDIISAVIEEDDEELTVTWTVRGELSAEPEAGLRHGWVASITDKGANRRLGVMREGATLTGYVGKAGPEGRDYKTFESASISGNTVTFRVSAAEVGARNGAKWMARSMVDRGTGDWERVDETEHQPFLR